MVFEDCCLCMNIILLGGNGGIRTPGRLAATHAFQACSIDHSDTFPKWVLYLASRLLSLA